MGRDHFRGSLLLSSFDDGPVTPVVSGDYLSSSVDNPGSPLVQARIGFFWHPRRGRETKKEGRRKKESLLLCVIVCLLYSCSWGLFLCGRCCVSCLRHASSLSPSFLAFCIFQLTIITFNFNEIPPPPKPSLSLTSNLSQSFGRSYRILFALYFLLLSVCNANLVQPSFSLTPSLSLCSCVVKVVSRLGCSVDYRMFLVSHQTDLICRVKSEIFLFSSLVRVLFVPLVWSFEASTLWRCITSVCYCVSPLYQTHDNCDFFLNM